VQPGSLQSGQSLFRQLGRACGRVLGNDQHGLPFFNFVNEVIAQVEAAGIPIDQDNFEVGIVAVNLARQAR